MLISRFIAVCDECHHEQVILCVDDPAQWIARSECALAFVPLTPPGWSSGIDGNIYCPRHSVSVQVTVDGRTLNS